VIEIVVELISWLVEITSSKWVTTGEHCAWRSFEHWPDDAPEGFRVNVMR